MNKPFEEVAIFFVKGDDAISGVRKIIGKRDPPSGIRKEHAESIIKNVAHGPDSLQAARREIQLIIKRGK